MKFVSPLRVSLPLSASQAEVVNLCNQGKSVAVPSCAGSGKSHTANHCTYNYYGPVHLIPFAASLRFEQSKRFETFPHVTVSNFHQRGRRICGNVQVDEKKVLRLAENLFDKTGHKVAALVGYLKQEAYGIADYASDIDSIAIKYGIRLTESEAEHCDKSLDEMAEEVLALSDADTKTIDFADMLRLPIIHGRTAFVSEDSLVILDEVQDFTPLAFEFLKACIVKQGTQVLMIGDPERQSLMQFAGASPELFDRMAIYFGCARAELNENRRCAKAICAAAPYSGNMVPLEDAPEGVVCTMPEDQVINDIRSGLYPHDAMLSETNAPLLKLGIKLLTEGVPVRMRMNKLNDLLFRYAYKHIVNRKLTVGDIGPLLREELAERAADGGDVSEFSDFVQCIEALELYCLSRGIVKTGWRNRRPLHPLQQALEELTSGTEGITLMTGHTAKGLEWNTVFYLPSKMKDPEQDWQVHQNQCLAHVIATRAKEKFVTLQ